MVGLENSATWNMDESSLETKSSWIFWIIWIQNCEPQPSDHTVEMVEGLRFGDNLQRKIEILSPVIDSLDLRYRIRKQVVELLVRKRNPVAATVRCPESCGFLCAPGAVSGSKRRDLNLLAQFKSNAQWVRR